MEYKFLEETPITKSKDNEIEFGHEEIISTLRDNVKNCCTPFTIGLFGSWGAGKSTIAKNLKDGLIKDNIPTIIFDVWKHEGDSLRRTFLIELVKQLKDSKLFNNKFELNKRVEGTVTKENNSQKFDYKNLFSTTFVLFITALPFIALLFFFWLIFIHWLKILDIPAFSVFALLTTFIAFLIKYASRFIKSEKVVETYDKYKDPHEFEQEFNTIISNLKSKRVLIVFDNLDRVSGENAIKTISTIKTFLEPVDIKNAEKEVVFLIPCDVNAIKYHLNTVFKSGDNNLTDNSNYADEFLRKFFNTILWIPEFFSTELEKFARKKLIETKIKDFNNDLLSSLITRIFSENPRQIIQFINVLISNYLLIDERENSNRGIEKDFLKNNVPQLAKYLLLIQKFPLMIEIYRQNNIFDLKSIDFEEIQVLNPEIKKEYYNSFDAFLKATSDVYIESLETFFRLRKSPQEQKIKGISRLIKKIVNNQFSSESDMEIITGLEIHEKVNDFSFVVIQYLKDNKNPVTQCRFLNGIFKITEHLDLNLTNRCYNEIDISIKESLVQVDKIDSKLITKELFNKYPKLRQYTKRDVIKQWIEILKDYPDKKRYKISEIYAIDLIQTLFTHLEDISIPDRDEVKVILLHFVNSIHITKQLSNSIELQDAFLSPRFLDSYFGHINEVDFENDSYKEKINFLLNIDIKYLSKDIATNYVVRMTDLIKNENSKPVDSRVEQKKNLMRFCARVYNKFHYRFVKIDNDNFKNNLINITVTGFNELGWTNCYIYFPLINEFEKSEEEPLLLNGISIKTNFLNQLHKTPIDGINYILEFFEKPVDFLDSDENKPALKKVALNNANFFDEYYNVVSSDSKVEWLMMIINSGNINRIKNTLTKLKFKTPDNNKIGDNLLLVFSQNINNKLNIEKLFELLTYLKLDKSKFNISGYKNLLKKILLNNNFQSYGLKESNSSIYLDNEDKAEIAGECLDWMSQNNYFLIETNEAIYNSFPYFDEVKQNQYVNFIIDRYIIGSNKNTYIDIGFRVLKGINPSFKILEYEAFINTLKEKITIMHNSNHPLKPNFVVGFKGLIEKINKRNKMRKELLAWLKPFEL